MKTLFAFFILIFSNIVYAAPKAELWAYWQASNDSNTASVSHQAWQSILDRNLVQVGENALFRYAEVTKEDKTLLNDYLDQLSNWIQENLTAKSNMLIGLISTTLWQWN